MRNTRFFFPSDNDGFEIQVSDSTLRAVKCINYEKYPLGVAKFTITATNLGDDGKTMQGEAAVEVSIRDINDNRPEFTNENFTVTKELDDLIPGNVLFQATAKDADQVWSNILQHHDHMNLYDIFNFFLFF